jgi:hypothetical protein
MALIKRNKCKHCRRLFVPDARNQGRQKYCSQSACQKASKIESQKRWLAKPENKNYFRGPENVLRVQQWREQHPGYRQRGRPKPKSALQEALTGQHLENTGDNGKNAAFALQDSLIMQPAVLIGLIANITGQALQDDMVRTVLGLQQLGSDILHYSPPRKGDDHDCQKTDFARPSAADTRKLQLGRPRPGPRPAS